MNNNLKPLYEKFKNRSAFVILSHTCDPQRDSVGRLKHYADSMQVDIGKWKFLTGPKENLYAAARHSYKIDDPNNFVQRPEDDFLHTQFVALVNKKGEVVKLYDGIKPSEMTALAGAIENLLN
ncbi:MAG: hypothetical protein NVS1B13_00240 [Flavisolibacter sp.]